MSAPKTFLAFDYGEKRIGVAIGDSLTRSARPLPALAPADRQAIERLVAEWRPAALIVGLPLDEDGSEQRITGPARRFAAALRQRLQLPVHEVDERYSSRAADELLREARASGRMTRRVRKGDRDARAACVILEQWLREKAD